MLIDGKLVDAEGGRTFANINPATELEIGQVADASAADALAAVEAAQRAFDESSWSTDPAFRARCLTQLHDALEREKETLRPLVVAEVGCPIMLTYAVQLDTPIDDMQWPIALIDRYEWEQDLGEHVFFGMNSRRVLRKEPVGVVAAITPWNYPIQVNLAKCIPALAAGNTVILKPAPDTPWAATIIGRLVAEQTDIPAGVFNVLTASDPAEVGEVLTSDPRVDCVSFTGSTAVGRRIMANSAPTVKKVFLELGGKSASIFLDDADFSGIGPAGASTCMHGGQGCAMLTRYLIPSSHYDESVEALKVAFEAVPYGDPMDMGNVMGPLVNARQRDRVLAHIERGKAEGARLLVGGGRPAHLDTGYFVEPTLFVDVDPDSTIAQEEIFGPVLAVIRYDGDDEAVRIANNSIYGLSGGVQSASESRAMDVARKIRTGTLSVNGGMYFGPDAPFGGYKQSGVGREMGVLGFEEFLETKTIGLPASTGA